jgi:site-specific recombinase XerD
MITAAPTISTLTAALTQYQALFLTARNLAPRTRREYVNDVDDLVDFLTSACAVFDAAAVTPFHLEAFLADLDRRGLRGSSRRRKVASLRSFFGYLEDAGVIAHSPARKLVPPAREHRQPRVLTENEYKRLLEAVRGDVRDAAIVELLLQTGIRLTELARLTLADVELPAKATKDPGNVGSVHLQGKGRKERTVTLNWKACKALKAYLQLRPKDAEDAHLFLTKFGKGMGPRAIQYLVEKYLGEANVAGASVHTLRHTFATHQVKKGTKLDVVRQALGHQDLKTTSIYVDLAREVMDRELQQNAL